jgi:hypothetical protein
MLSALVAERKIRHFTLAQTLAWGKGHSVFADSAAVISKPTGEDARRSIPGGGVATGA